MKIDLTHALIKQQVTLLRDFLEKEITQSSGYNCIAKIYGFKDWNTFKAFLDKELENK